MILSRNLKRIYLFPLLGILFSFSPMAGAGQVSDSVSSSTSPKVLMISDLETGKLILLRPGKEIMVMLKSGSKYQEVVTEMTDSTLTMKYYNVFKTFAISEILWIRARAKGMAATEAGGIAFIAVGGASLFFGITLALISSDTQFDFSNGSRSLNALGAGFFLGSIFLFAHMKKYVLGDRYQLVVRELAPE